MAEYTEKDYDQIEAAVLNTARGRWFLSEHARRHRVADTQTLLDAIAKLERGIGLHVQGGMPAPALSELDDIAKSVTVAKQELSSVASGVGDEIVARKVLGALALINFAEERLDALIAAYAQRAPAAAEGHASSQENQLHPGDDASRSPESTEAPSQEEGKPRILVVRRKSSEETHIPLLEDQGSETPAAGPTHA